MATTPTPTLLYMSRMLKAGKDPLSSRDAS